MQNLLVRCLLGAILLSLPVATDGQTRRRRGTTPQRRTARPAPAPQTTAEMTAARDQLTEQIKLLSRFLYLYGRISSTIEINDRDGSNAQSTAQSRAALVANVRNLRAGLDDLAERFSRVPSLAGYTLRVNAASDLVRQAETSIAAGNLDEAGRSLVSVVNGLTDVLATMR